MSENASSRQLLHAEECFNVLFVDCSNQREVGQVTFLLLGLFGENVAFESVFSLDLS